MGCSFYSSSQLTFGFPVLKRFLVACPLIYDMFLQKKRISELDEINKDQELKFLNYVTGLHASSCNCDDLVYG